ncbi:hypothetical protein ACKWTF_001454 [Chironomus riparius]
MSRIIYKVTFQPHLLKHAVQQSKDYKMDLKLLFLNLLLALQLRFGSFFETEKNGKIFGGKRIEINEVPWQVALEHVTKGFFCGGSILSKSWILTAAHCVTVNLSEWFVRSGSSIRSKGGEVHKVIKIFIHPNYHEITYDILDYDFALLKIQNPINFDAYRQPIKLAEPHMYQQGDLVFASGYGETKNPTETDEFLKGTVLHLTGDSCCLNIYPEMTRSMVCAKGKMQPYVVVIQEVL